MSQPNILVVLTDDHGQWAANCYGTPEIRSPNMDFLAATGARMVNAFTPTPVCSPARACFYTGRYASQHGIHDWIQEAIPEFGDKDWMANEITVYQLLSDAGYHVGHFGKWHCGRSDVSQPGCDRWFAIQKGQGAHHGSYVYRDEDEDVEIAGFKSRIVTDTAVDWIRGGHDDKPWMAFVGLIPTHGPHGGLPERLVEPYRGVANKAIGTIDPPPDSLRMYRKQDVPEFQAQYFAAVSEIDEQLGRLIDAVDERGQLDNTVIVYTGDHGLHAGQLGYWEKGNGTRPINMYERSIRIPMLMRCPGKIQAGQAREEPVDLCDLFHTLLDFAGAPVSAELRETGKHAGGSFAPMLSGENQAWREVQFGEYGPVRMIRSRTHKLIRRNHHGHDQLFDLVNDPDERRNVIDEAVHADVVADLGEQLRAFFKVHTVPENDGWTIRDRLRLHNDKAEPWRPEFDDYTCTGWKE